MNRKNRENWITFLIQSTMEAVGIDIELKEDRTGVNMSYNFILDYIGFDVKRIKEAIEEMMVPVSLESYIKALTLHELGHALDREALMKSMTKTLEIYHMKKDFTMKEQFNDSKLLFMLIEEHEMNIRFEETAWKNAESLNEEYGIVDWASFEKVKSQGMATYMHSYERDLQVYNKLVVDQNEQIA